MRLCSILQDLTAMCQLLTKVRLCCKTTYQHVMYPLKYKFHGFRFQWGEHTSSNRLCYNGKLYDLAETSAGRQRTTLLPTGYRRNPTPLHVWHWSRSQAVRSCVYATCSTWRTARCTGRRTETTCVSRLTVIPRPRRWRRRTRLNTV